jgi:hypothetical protein
MTERPVFIPAPDDPALVRVINFGLVWHSGFAPVQKQKNIRALHAAAAAAGYTPVLEISTKAEDKLGQHLSAFRLKVETNRAGKIPLECAFQGSKIFELGGPYTDLYFAADPREAKRDLRLQKSGRIIGFDFDGFRFPTEPKTAFYDWLYITAIFEHRDWLKPRLSQYVGFTDIEFNPAKSINCQARSCALFAALLSSSLLEGAVESPTAFLGLMMNRDEFVRQRENARTIQNHELFPR